MLANSSPHRMQGESQIEFPPKYPFEIIHTDHFGHCRKRKTVTNLYLRLSMRAHVTLGFSLLRRQMPRNACKSLKFLFNVFGKPLMLVSDLHLSLKNSQLSLMI